jgi:hypothetical protein
VNQIFEIARPDPAGIGCKFRSYSPSPELSIDPSFTRQIADPMLQQLRNNKTDKLNELIIMGFMQQVKIFASSQGESTER